MKKKEVIKMYGQDFDNPPEELLDIQYIWREKANAYGDVGSCVLGAGFNFKYKGLYYKMYPISIWQGSCSWEASVPEITQMLNDIGCTDVYFEWGNMD